MILSRAYGILFGRLIFFGHRLFVRRTGQAIINMIPLSLAILEILPFSFFCFYLFSVK